MSRYPRSVRPAKFKCLSCNAPVTITVEGEHCCVECGRQVFRPRTLDQRSHNGPPQGGEASELEVNVKNETARKLTATRNLDQSGNSRGHSQGDGPSDAFLLPPTSTINPEISFVMPTMNEEQGIGDCIDRAIRAVQQLNMTAEIIVSDCSTDRTPEIAASKGAHVVSPDELGYGAAYQYGFKHARGDYIVMGDADMTYDFEELPKLMKPLLDGNADIVMGSRFAGEIRPGAMPKLHKYVGNPVLTAFLNLFYDAGVSDAHSGFRVLTRDALENVDVRSQGMEFASEMVMVAGAQDLRIEEVPITYHERVGEAKLESFRDGWRHMKFMLTNCPTYLFTAPGIGFGLLGVMLMAMSVLDLQVGAATFGLTTLFLGSLLTIMGYQITMIGFSTSMGANPIRKPRGPLARWVEEGFTIRHATLLALGVVILVGGYSIYVPVDWLGGSVSTTQLPSLLVMMTMIVIAIETILFAFHFSALGEG